MHNAWSYDERLQHALREFTPERVKIDPNGFSHFFFQIRIEDGFCLFCSVLVLYFVLFCIFSSSVFSAVISSALSCWVRAGSDPFSHGHVLLMSLEEKHWVLSWGTSLITEWCSDADYSKQRVQLLSVIEGNVSKVVNNGIMSSVSQKISNELLFCSAQK